MTPNKDFLQSFKPVPKTGVIYVLEKATEMGYCPDSKKWANLGQGAPDTGPLDDEPGSRRITINPANSEYGPVSGINDLRHAIAEYYNILYRKDSMSKYTYKNVCVAGGGRLALSRVVSALGNINLGHFIPDYTAYEELLGVFKNFVPIPILLDKEKNYKIILDDLKEEILGRGLSALLISNPCNPTGQVITGSELDEWVKLSRELSCVMMFDEFYSHYVYGKNNMISASQYVHDVNHDPLLIINGLSKNWRSPGWRLGWVLGPEDIIERVSSVGSFMDGGPVHPLQAEAIKLLNTDKTQADAGKIQSVFSEKRSYCLQRLKEIGIDVEIEPEATFYIWCNISSLPAPISSCFEFFKECLKENVIVVPGVFFDVNPGKRRLQKHSRYNNYVRISFGPKMESLKTGLDSIERVIQKFKK